jgi:hypothetical protein
MSHLRLVQGTADEKDGFPGHAVTSH